MRYKFLFVLISVAIIIVPSTSNAAHSKNYAPVVEWNVPKEIKQGWWIPTAPKITDRNGNLRSVLIEWGDFDPKQSITVWKDRRGSKMMPRDERTINPPCYNGFQKYTITVTAVDGRGAKTVRRFSFNTIHDPEMDPQEGDIIVELDADDPDKNTATVEIGIGS